MVVNNFNYLLNASSHRWNFRQLEHNTHLHQLTPTPKHGSNLIKKILKKGTGQSKLLLLN
jgi:hypothetical protein